MVAALGRPQGRYEICGRGYFGVMQVSLKPKEPIGLVLQPVATGPRPVAACLTQIYLVNINRAHSLQNLRSEMI